ncbi:MAG TPA: M10 family metallopeptidase C-terminal domain-containing protein [Aestuariivirga sp.]|nr:M10 family metallopeptidase C-terminal domain-containing protein [Aestuariivirga sp.]
MCELCLQFPTLDWHNTDQPLDAGTVDGATSSGESVSFNSALIDQLVSGSKWTDSTNAVASTISFGFTTNNSFATGYGEATGWSATTTAQQVAIREMMQTWDDLIAPSFVEATGSAGNTADIKFSNTTSNNGYAHAYYPGQTNNESFSYAKLQGSVWLNPNYNTGTNSLVTPTKGIYGYQAILHEIGHTLGLNHAGNYNGGTPKYGDTSTGWLFAEDSHMNTIMSYFTASNTGAAWGGKYAQTPMVYDIMAIQQIYGADYTTRAGDTVYGFNSTAGRDVYNFTLNTSPILTIWDGGGNDTIDVSGWSTSSTIFLAAGSYSSVNGMKYNLAIAYDCDIENVTCGAGNDNITGNDLANILIGNGGADTINGAYGNDLIDGGLGNDILNGNRGIDIIHGGDGIDNINGGLDDDTIYGDNGADILAGGQGNDIIYGGNDNDTLDGGDGNDILDGGAGADVLTGGAGDDIIYIDANDVMASLDGGTGYDVVIETGAYVPFDLSAHNLEELRVVINDTGSANWSQTTDYYNTAGELFRHDISFDNGTSSVTDYDVDNTQSWSERTRTYDTNGNLLSETTVQDSGGPTSNSAPTNISLSAAAIAENSTNGSIIGTLSTADPDANDTFSYMLLNNAGGRFAIQGNKITVANGTLLNFEDQTSHQISVRVTDSGGNQIDRNFTISVTDVNEAPSNITISNATVVENAAHNSLVGTLSATDPDTGDTLTYTLLDNALARFSLSGQDILVNDGPRIDYERWTSHTITVQAMDSAGNTTTRDIVISVIDQPGVVLTGTNGRDTLTGTAEDDELYGLNNSDKLYGMGGNDILSGGDGGDRLDGGTGADAMSGGAGNDRYIVDNVNDQVIELAGGGKDTVVSTATIALPANVETISLKGNANIGAVGNDLDNRIRGNAADNIIAGGGGVDILVGGDGADTFVFSSLQADGSISKIVDFTSGVDMIALDTSGASLFSIVDGSYGALAQQSPAAFELVVGQAAATNVATILYDASNGILSYDADGTGGLDAIVIAKITGMPAITADDFLIL